MDENRTPLKRIGTIIGAILLIIGIILFISSFLYWGPGEKELGEEGSFEESVDRGNMWFGLGAGGMTLMFFGYALIYITNLKRISKFVAKETSPGVETFSDAVGKGVASGINDAGGLNIRHGSTSEEREIIKVRCRKCKYLEREHAKFCSRCGSKM